MALEKVSMQCKGMSGQILFKDSSEQSQEAQAPEEQDRMIIAFSTSLRKFSLISSFVFIIKSSVKPHFSIRLNIKTAPKVWILGKEHKNYFNNLFYFVLICKVVKQTNSSPYNRLFLRAQNRKENNCNFNLNTIRECHCF